MITIFLLCAVPVFAQNGYWDGTIGGKVYHAEWNGECHNDQPQFNRNILTAFGKSSLTSGSNPGDLETSISAAGGSWLSCFAGLHDTGTICYEYQTLDGDKIAQAGTQDWTTSSGVISAHSLNVLWAPDETFLGGGTHSFGITCPTIVVCTEHCGSSPIIIPLGVRPEVKFSSPDDGVNFDINGDGAAERVSWPVDPSQSAWLAIDRDGDGLITSGKELLGDRTIQGDDNGFTALFHLMGRFDPDAPGWVSVAQPNFASLLLWRDLNRDGVSQPEELQPASNVLLAIKTAANNVGKKDPNGTTYRLQGEARYVAKPNAVKPIYDAFLAQQ